MLAPPRNGPSRRIVTVEVNEQLSVFVTAAKGEFYATSDLGRNWTPLKGGKWALWLQFPNVIPAPSDPSVRYRYEPIGVIQRSEDGGANWSVPRPTIQGRSAEDVAFRVSGARDYVLEFAISTVHPLKPSTIYASISVVPPRRPGGDSREQYVLRGMYVSEDGGNDSTPFIPRHGGRNHGHPWIDVRCLIIYLI